MDFTELLEKAHHLTRIGRYDDAISVYDKVLEADKNNTTAYENKGKVYYYLGRHDDALTCYDQALGIEPNLTTAWYEKGYTLRKIGRYIEAIRLF